MKDSAGNEFVCPIASLRNVKDVSEEIHDNCVDDAAAGGYADNIEILK